MEITFSKSGEVYVAEFSVTGDFNLHIEGVTAGDVQVFQRGTASGSYARVKSVNPYSYEKVYDYDFSAVVYPKYIKIVSEVEPTLAVVTSAGEVTEIGAKNKFSIKKHVIANDTPTPIDEPAIVFEIPREGMTWREYCAENSDFIVRNYLGSPSVFYKSTHILTRTTEFSSVVLGDDSIISGYEYLAVYIPS